MQNKSYCKAEIISEWINKEEDWRSEEKIPFTAYISNEIHKINLCFVRNVYLVGIHRQKIHAQANKKTEHKLKITTPHRKKATVLFGRQLKENRQSSLINIGIQSYRLHPRTEWKTFLMQVAMYISLPIWQLWLV